MHARPACHRAPLRKSDSEARRCYVIGPCSEERTYVCMYFGAALPRTALIRNKRFGSEHDRLWESLLQHMAACGYSMRDGLLQQL